MQASFPVTPSRRDLLGKDSPIMRSIRPYLLYVAGMLSLLCLSAPAEAQNHPFRITAGFDSSQNEGLTGGNSFESTYFRTTGAFRLGLSFDVVPARPNALAGFVYADLSSPVIDGTNSGYGLGARFYPGVSGGGYGGAAIGLYDRAVRSTPDDDTVAVGLKFLLGYETRGTVFFETGLTLIVTDGYQASPAFLIGFRL
ncbi:MAG: hypothetical protein H7145_17890 [Akkermansiaceae bacterium]|nr:hypothetical protein [Armatimonadota bacterium]